ncbi:SNF2 family amino-terminal protein, partial [Trifolium pratense]
SDDGNSNDVDNDEEEIREEEKENEISDSDGSSNDVIVDDDEEEEFREEEKKGLSEPNNVVEEDKEENLDPLWQECDKYLMEEEERLKEVKDKKIGICKRNNQKKKIKIRDEEKKGLRKPNNVVEEDREEIMEEKKDSDKQKMAENKLRKDYKGRFNIQNGDKKESKDNNGLNRRGKSAYFTSKDLSLVKLLAECYSDKQNTMKNDPILLDNDDGDDVNPQETRKPPVCVETPLIWSLKKVQKVELTEEEEEERRKNEELKPIWDEFETAEREMEAEYKIGNLGTNEATRENNGSPSSRCEHDIIYDEEIGDYCKSCAKIERTTIVLRYVAIQCKVLSNCG